mgnify:FL=1
MHDWPAFYFGFRLFIATRSKMMEEHIKQALEIVKAQASFRTMSE